MAKIWENYFLDIDNESKFVKYKTLENNQLYCVEIEMVFEWIHTDTYGHLDIRGHRRRKMFWLRGATYLTNKNYVISFSC